jgi:regulator of sirC expression with transglutaminase-like and TPR domain
MIKMKRLRFISQMFVFSVLWVTFVLVYNLCIETEANDVPTTSDYDKSLEINPKDAVAYFNKASVYEKMGQIKEAISAYKDFIRYAPPQYYSLIEQIKEKIRMLEGRLRLKK